MQSASHPSVRTLLPVAALLAQAALLAMAAGCATAPRPQPFAEADRQRFETALGGELAQEFEAEMGVRNDAELALYLRALASRIAEASPELRGGPVGVQVIKDRSARWRSYGLPGNRIYLSRGFLRGVEYESELAAAVAMELAHVSRKHVHARLALQAGTPQGAEKTVEYATLQGLLPLHPAQPRRPLDFFGARGIFAYEEAALMEAAESAVGFVYRAGFDPRGLIVLWTRYQGAPAHSPYPQPVLAKLIEETRRVIANYVPLRDPIVRSPQFIAIQRRIKRL
jgi:predicted Zn-dependent protease